MNTINKYLKIALIVLIQITYFLKPNFAIAQVTTALGPIGTGPKALVNDILKIGVNAAGGIAFLLMLYGGFLFLTSGGDENKLHEATEVITSAIAGLLVIIFSVFLLQLIGKDILQIF